MPLGKRRGYLAMILLFAIIISIIPSYPWENSNSKAIAVQTSQYYTLCDEEGRTITVTGRRVTVGDQYLDANNNLYEVVKVDGLTAWCKFLGKVDLEEEGLRGTKETVADLHVAQEQEEFREVVAIYHTHNAESFLPSDGTDSIYGQGGIHRVGAAMAEALEEKGINVIHSQDLHLPHDRGAYRRSRVTVIRLIETQEPDVLFDVHRDAAPPEVYSAQVDDTSLAQVQFVVGRQNPTASVNRRLAYDLKSYADNIYPGLVKGVFLAWGSYNQDLTPFNMLLEIGAHTNSREEAKKGAIYFADVVGYYFYGISPDETVTERDASPPAGREEAPGPSIFEALAGIIGGVALGGVGFFLLNNPKRIKEMEKKLYFYTGKSSPLRQNAEKNIALWKEGLTDIGTKIFKFFKMLQRKIRR